MLVDRDAASVIGHGDRAVGVDAGDDRIAIATERFVDRVVDDFANQVVHATLAGAADVHARSLANRFEALEDLNGAGVVAAGGFGFLGSSGSRHVGVSPLARKIERRRRLRELDESRLPLAEAIDEEEHAGGGSPGGDNSLEQNGQNETGQAAEHA